MTHSPIKREATSRSLTERSWRTISRTTLSTASLATGRFCKARSTPVRNLRSSNASRRPSLFTIAGSLISTVSNVLKRSPHCSHSRRRRIVAPSSASRESITRVSSWWQKGQCTPGLRHVNRVFPALRRHLVAHSGDDFVVARRVQHIADPIGQVDTIGLLIATRGHRRRTDTQARRDERFLRIVRHCVLVHGDVRL